MVEKFMEDIINLKDYQKAVFRIDNNGKINLGDGKKKIKNLKPLTLGLFMLNSGKLKGHMFTSLNYFRIKNATVNCKFSKKKNKIITNIHKPLKALKRVSKNPRIYSIVGKNNLELVLTENNYLVYLKDCSNINIVSSTYEPLILITENCSGNIKIISEIVKKKEKKCPKIECPQIECAKCPKCPKKKCPIKICPKPNDIYYQGALGGVVFILICLVLYNVFNKCK